MVERFSGFFPMKKTASDDGTKAFTASKGNTDEDMGDASFPAMFSGFLLMNVEDDRRSVGNLAEGSRPLAETADPLLVTPESSPVAPGRMKEQVGEIRSVADYLLSVTLVQDEGGDRTPSPVFASPVDLADLSAATKNQLHAGGTDQPFQSTELKSQAAEILKAAVKPPAASAGDATTPPVQDIAVQPVLLALGEQEDSTPRILTPALQVRADEKMYLFVADTGGEDRPVELIGHPVQEKHLENFIPVKIVDGQALSDSSVAETEPFNGEKQAQTQVEIPIRQALQQEGSSVQPALDAEVMPAPEPQLEGIEQPENTSQPSSAAAVSAPSAEPSPEQVRENDLRLQEFIRKTEPVMPTTEDAPARSRAVQLDLFAGQMQESQAARETQIADRPVRHLQWQGDPALSESNREAVAAKPASQPERLVDAVSASLRKSNEAPAVPSHEAQLRKELKISVFEVTGDTTRDKNGQVYFTAQKKFETPVAAHATREAVTAPELIDSTETWRSAVQEALDRMDGAGVAKNTHRQEPAQLSDPVRNRALFAYGYRAKNGDENSSPLNRKTDGKVGTPTGEERKQLRIDALLTLQDSASEKTVQEKPALAPANDTAEPTVEKPAHRQGEHAQRPSEAAGSASGKLTTVGGSGQNNVAEQLAARESMAARTATKSGQPTVMPQRAERFEHVRMQIADQVQPDRSVIRIVLRPESLGTVRLTMTLQDGLLAARFLVDSEETRMLLESGMDSLKATLHDKGIRADSVQVNLQPTGQQVSRGEQGSQTSTQDQQKESPAGNQEHERKKQQKKQDQEQHAFDRYL